MHNKVELLGHYGNDLVIASSAWTSTYRDLEPDKIARADKLIHQLWKAGHETPFEKGVVHFLIDTEIATHIQFLKHRISSFNGESARYKALKEDKFYLPEDWKGIEVTDETIPQLMDFVGKMDWAQALEEYTKLGNYLYKQALIDLTTPLGRKRAKESARFFKTYNSQIQGDVMFNMRSFANFQKLRNSEYAQKEIREVAQQMLELVENIPGNPFKHTLEAWQSKK